MKRSLALLVLAALLLALAGCSQQNGSSDGKPTEEGPPKQEQAAPEPKPVEYSSWVVYINDDDSYSAGGMTYKIALNFTATNPTGDIAGTYKGNATASTTTQGNVGGAQLNAQAIAQSGNLQFTLEDPTAGGALAPLTTGTPDAAVYSGTGTITMKASGTASVGPASGGYSNTSSQKIDVKVNGSKVTLSVVIQGHKYTFDGTISGK